MDNMPMISQVERSAMHHIVGWMKDTIKEFELPFSVEADIELTIQGVKRRFPDILIFASYPNEVACLIEYKPPIFHDPYDPKLVDDTYQETCHAPGMFHGTCRYFGTWNTNKFILWDRKDYDASSFLNMRYRHYDVALARNINDIKRAIIEESIKKFIKKFLKELYAIYFEKKPIPSIPIDELFIYRLRTAIDTFFVPISEEIYKKAKKDQNLKRSLRKWFSEQGWLFQDNLDSYDKTARQYAYLIMDKIIFYNLLRRHEKNLEEIKLPQKLSAIQFKNLIQNYFNNALDIDYEPIFAANFIESIPLPGEIIPQIVSFINSIVKNYKFEEIGYETLGRVFERLIPDRERHQLGQYYTRSDVVDLITGFCIKSADDIILDPACGAATFLIRAYSLIKLKNSAKIHREILNQLYGIDISKFAAHLSMINLTSKDLSEKENYPLIVHEDFFNVLPQKVISRKYKIKKLIGKLADIKIPSVDVVIGNPPYTRQEKMEGTFEDQYKNKLNEVLKRDFNVTIGKRSGIYSYFFIHGAKFLKQRGRFGFITSNVWLDVDYGKYLQQFFLKRFKIKVVIESKVERWFEDADINTCITILEKCEGDNNKKERGENLVKFVQLKVPLKELILTTEEEQKRWSSIEELIKRIENSNEYFEDEKIRIFPKQQHELFDEGYDEEQKKYVGSKWGKYIRAPKIFFKILSKYESLFIQLDDVADVKRGFTTGANNFFYLTEKEIKALGIEKEFWMHIDDKKWIPNYVMKSPRESKNIVINSTDLKHRVLMIHKDKKELNGTNVLKYIESGEEHGFHERPTCASRKKWYDLGVKNKVGDTFWTCVINDRYVSFLNTPNVYCDCELFHIYSQNPMIPIFLNSTIIILFSEVESRLGLGLGALKKQVYEVKRLPFPKAKIPKIKFNKMQTAFKKMLNRPIGTVFDEIGTKSFKEVSIKTVKSDRRRLDKIIMGDILGLTKDEQLEVYQAVVDLIKSRLEKAKSVKKTSKKGKVKIADLAENILKETRIDELKRFPEEYIGNVKTDKKHVPVSGEVIIATDLFNGLHLKINGEIVKCENMEEAKYLRYAILNGNQLVKIPIDIEILKKVVKEYGDLVNEIRAKAKEILNEFVPDRKLKQKIESEIERRIFRKMF